MVTRIALVAVAALIGAWLVLTLHHVNLQSEAEGLVTAHPSPPTVDRIQGILHRAAKSNPDVTPRLLEATVLGLGGRNREAAAVSLSVLREEPYNIKAAIGLYVNLRVYDPAAAVAAAARIRSIAPPVKR